MNATEADRLLGTLIGATSGWNSATEMTVEVYKRNFQALRDHDCAEAAVYDVINTWKEARRPPWAIVLEAYRGRWREKALSQTNVLPLGRERILSPTEGRQVAARAYAAERAKQGKEPNWPWFHDILRESVGRDPEEGQ